MKFAVRLFVFSLVVFTLAMILRLSTRDAATEASDYAPRSIPVRTLQAKTTIPAILSSGISEATKRDDKVIAFVAEPVTVGGDIAIPAKSQLNGVVDEIDHDGETAKVVIRFSELLVHDRSVHLDTEPSTSTVPLVSDFEVLGDAFEATTGSILGTAVGAASGNQDAVRSGATWGGLIGTPSAGAERGRVSVVLASALRVPKG